MRNGVSAIKKKLIKNLNPGLFLSILFIFFCLARLQPPLYAQSLSGTTALPTVKVALNDDQSIIVARILHSALKRSGYQMASKVTGMRTSVADVNYGDAAILPLQTEGWERLYPNLIKIPVPVEWVEFTTFTRANDSYQFSSWSDLEGLRLCYRWQNQYIAENVHRAGASALVIVNEHEDVWNALLEYRADVVVLPRLANEFRLPYGIKMVDVIERLPCYSYVNKDFAHLAPMLEKTYLEMIEDGSMELIRNNRQLPDGKQVMLHISSYNMQLERERSNIEHIRQAFEQIGGIDYRNFNLNSHEHHNLAGFDYINADTIRAYLVERSPDVIIVSDNEALQFVLTNYFLLFPKVPVAFCGVNNLDLFMLYGLNEYITGVSESISFHETVTEMLRLYPRTQRIFILNDYTLSRSFTMRKDIEKGIVSVGLPVGFIFSQNKPIAEILEDIRGMDDTLVLIGSYNIDSDSIFYSEAEVQKLVSEVSPNPVFCLTNSFIGHGPLGGMVSATDVQSRIVANMAEAILKGISPGMIPAIFDSASLNRWQFDYATAKRHNINVNTLPAGHVIVNRVLPVWESNPTEFRLAMGLAVLFLLIIFGLILFLDLLRKKQMEATAANKAKTSFIRTMSHEIRTPLNAILGITEIQLQNYNLDQRAREALERIFSSGDLLLGIINDILDLSKIETGKMEIVGAKYDLASMISDTALLNMMRIGSKPIEFILKVNENIPRTLIGDELQLKQILNNLLSNAFKYTSAGKVIMSVHTEEIAGAEGGPNSGLTLVISVSDTGQGMTKEQVRRLFDEFTRFNLEANRSTEGSGLGMSITQNLVQLMNGKLFIDSTPGKGSVFTVRLPQRKVDSIVLGREMADNLLRYRISSKVQMKRVQILREPMPYGSVLIVDDVETNTYVVQGLLFPYELKVDTADSGFVAIEKIKSGRTYDIIFMDHMMPKMDGIETVKIIRSMGYAKPIVALTANVVAGQAEVFLDNGFDDFISKPIDIRQLNIVLNKMIRDIQPPEVLEAVRKNAKSETRPQEFNAMYSPQMNSRTAEVFIRDATKAIASIRAIYESSDYRNREGLRLYTIYVHGIKTALANIGKMDLSALALKLEVAGKGENYNIIETETMAFLDSLSVFTDELKTKQETTADTGEEIVEDTEKLTGKLNELKKACEECDENTAEKILDELRKTAWPQETKDFLYVITRQLLHSDFDEIVDGINKFMFVEAE